MKAVAEHLGELRARLINTIFFLILFWGAGILLSPYIIKHILDDFQAANFLLVSLSPLEFIYTQLKIGLVFSFCLGFPIILYNAISFIRPGLREKERAALKYFLPGFILLFVAGALFAYFAFLRITIWFLANLSSLANIENIWSIERFISFMIMIIGAMGIVFELPLLLILLNRLNLLDEKRLAKHRPHIYVGAFIAAALISPPDVITQVMLAVPIIILFEAAYMVIRASKR